MGETEADLKSSRIRHIKSPVSKPHILLTGSENVLPLAQPVLPRAEQSKLMLFFSSLKNYWIWVVLSCNEQVSVPKMMLLFLDFSPQDPELQVVSACYLGCREKRVWNPCQRALTWETRVKSHLLGGFLIIY